MGAVDIVGRHFRTRDNVPIFYRDTVAVPDAPRVLLIHPLALDSSVWQQVMARLAPHARVVAVDCRGHGQSGRVSGPYSVELFAADVAELMAHLGWERATVAGCSMGGCVAQALAAQHSELVQALILVDTTAWYGPDAPEKWRERADQARRNGLKSMIEFQQRRWFSDAFIAAHRARVEEVTSVFLSNHVDCYAETCIMMGDMDMRPWLTSFAMPVAVIVGEDDYATPVAASEALCAAIPGAQLTMLPKARHLTVVERPDDIADGILKLLREAELSTVS